MVRRGIQMSRIWKHHVAVIGTALLLASLFGLTGCGKTEKAPTTIMLTSCSNPSFYGESVCFIATVTTESGWISGGTVAFYDGDALLGSRSQTWLQEHGSGQFAFATDMTDLAVGSHDIVAVFEGKGDFAGSTSETLTQLVSQVPAAWERWSLPGDDALYGVWGSSSTDVFAVTMRGTVLHYDGINWSSMTTGNPTWFKDVWGTSAIDVFAAGLYGTILHYDGSAWNSMTSNTTYYPEGIWGSSTTDVFAVGLQSESHQGAILHYDGSAWTSMTSNTGYLNGVWGSSSSDIFAVGSYGTILHYDGSTWSAVSSGTTQQLNGVWGTSASDVFAVGVQGVILHYDGSTWSTMASFATCGCWDDLHAPHGYEDMSGCLFGVWGSAWNDVYAVGWKDGTGGIILHYDGSIWSTSFGIENVILRDVWGGSSSDVLAVGDGGTILHYAG